MTATSIGRMAVPFVALAAACVAAIAFGVPYVWREHPVETRAAALAVAPPSPNVVAATTAPALTAPSHRPSSGDVIKPAFDAAVIG